MRAAAKGLDRLDVYVDGRPVGWHDLPSEGKSTRSVTFERPQGEQVEVLGYAGSGCPNAAGSRWRRGEAVGSPPTDCLTDRRPEETR